MTYLDKFKELGFKENVDGRVSKIIANTDTIFTMLHASNSSYSDINETKWIKMSIDNIIKYKSASGEECKKYDSFGCYNGLLSINDIEPVINILIKKNV